MKKLFFDIETIPCDESMKDMFVEIKRKLKSNVDIDELDGVEDLYAQSALDGTFGRICCIAYIKEGNGKMEKGVLKGDERTMLIEFWRVAADVNQLVGHNVFDFDIPFIIKRSIIHSIKPRFINLAKFRSDSVYDTMYEWEKWAFGKKVKLDTLAKVFGFPTSKDVMDGSQVWPAFKDGKIDEICTYCMKDVELTRQVYYRMQVEPIPEYGPRQAQLKIDGDIPF
jgi:3'-5' exonuclease